MWQSNVVVAVVFVVVVVELTSASGPPSQFIGHLTHLNFANEGYYLTSEDAVSISVDDLQRGHEALIVKMNDLISTLRENELKLNNVFYKLGRHDTDLEGMDSSLGHLGDTSRKIEGKLNKHAYNVDFLRQKVEELYRESEGAASVKAEVVALRSLSTTLHHSLAEALARLGLLENTTKTLEKRSTQGSYFQGSQFEEFSHGPFEAAERPPTLTVYPRPNRDTCRVEFEQLGSDCYWFGEEHLTYTEATAACTRHGGSLLTLPAPGTQLDLLLGRLNNDTMYWSGATDAFRHDHWVYLMTAQPVMPTHWQDTHADTPTRHHCAVMTRKGLKPRACTHRHPYVCRDA